MWSGDALAKAPPPKAKELSAISQYRESIPGASGPTLPGAQSVQTPLPPPVQKAVERSGGSDAPTLRKLSEESSLGAPVKRLPPVPKIRGRLVVERGAAAAVFSGAGNLLTDGNSGHLVGLVVVMVLLALAAAAAAAVRRHSSS